MIEADCRTTAMGIMPCTSMEKALGLALSLDIPFWPQLPRLGFYQDLYAQTARGFPGIYIDIKGKRLSFSTARFREELPRYAAELAGDAPFELSGDFGALYRLFLEQRLDGCHAIRGHVAGPVSLGFSVLDETRKPLVYDDEVRTLLLDFIQRKVNLQFRQLKTKNANVFIWLDDPALTNVFSGLYGYNDRQAKEDYAYMLKGMSRPHGLHLCTNVNLPFLLELGIDILSFNAYQLESMPAEYAASAARFMAGGGIICWGIVPTDTESLTKENPESLTRRLLDYWGRVSGCGIPLEKIARQSLLAPARCSIMDFWRSRQAAGEEPAKPGLEDDAVETAFSYLRKISAGLRASFGF